MLLPKKKKKKLQHIHKTQDADVYPKKKGRLLPEVAVVIGEESHGDLAMVV